MNGNEKRLVVVTGPTAVGKTKLAVALARRCRGEIVSVDSRQVYRGLDVGTGKDLNEYARGGEAVKHHLIDIVEPVEDYSLMRFLVDAAEAIESVDDIGSLPILAGGTPLYLKALLSDYDMPGGPPLPATRRRLRAKPTAELERILSRLSPKARREPDQANNRNRMIRAIEKTLNPKTTSRNRLELRPLVLAVYYPRDEVRRRIAERLDKRLNGGLIEEVQRLRREGLSWERLDYFGLEYRYVSRYLKGALSRAEMREKLVVRIRRFAKSQDVWFRKFERSGIPIHWLPRGDLDEAFRLVERFLARDPLPEPTFKLANVHYGPKSGVR